jgi:hypothetical protein
MIWQHRLALTASHESNIAQVGTTISLKRSDFWFVVRGYQFVPVEPQSPAIGQRVGTSIAKMLVRSQCRRHQAAECRH